jgi:hypothetical protein
MVRAPSLHWHSRAKPAFRHSCEDTGVAREVPVAGWLLVECVLGCYSRTVIHEALNRAGSEMGLGANVLIASADSGAWALQLTVASPAKYPPADFPNVIALLDLCPIFGRAGSQPTESLS